VRGVRRAVGDAAVDLRSAWSASSWAWLTVAVVAFAAPAAIGEARTGDVAGWLCTALAAVGLNAAVGLGGIPVLSQGAFMAVGAFAVGKLSGASAWDPASAALVGVALSLVAGAAVGVVATRLRPAFVAVATWLVAWLVGLALTAFPALSGGAQGLVVRNVPFHPAGIGPVVTMTPTILYETAAALLFLALLAYRTVARNRPGLGLAAVRQGPAEAAALGVPAARLEWGAVVAAAGVAGAAGALSVQVAGVADPAAFGPLRSVELFVAVVLGGAGTTLGPVVGAAVLAALPRISTTLGSALGVERERFEPVVAAVLLLAALLLLGRGGLVRLAADGWRRLRPSPDEPGRPERSAVRRGADRPTPPVPDDRTRHEAPTGQTTKLEARALLRRFGGVVAVGGIDLELPGGEVRALIGPNGSGKTTLLRLLAGDLEPDDGTMVLNSHDLTALPTRDRVAAGVVRTLQATAVFPGLTALEQAVAGTDVRRRDAGAVRTVLATPRSRADAAAARDRALAALAEVGLDHRANVPAERLTATEQRLLTIAAALASGPRILLLDEPAAGLSASDLGGLAELLRRLATRGMAVLLVEHNLRLVRRAADAVTVLDAGTVIASGRPEDVAADPDVRMAYLGRAAL
jgi:branched-chain amino acid transport system ATP-binding protein/branched-chain amino acid transport system permease protein